jgi:phosphatidylserine/phosphatidylglycerophosphate/cardiolipin synthase-like enzyme
LVTGTEVSRFFVFSVALSLALAAISPAFPAASVASGAAIATCFSPEQDCLAFAADAIDRAEQQILVNASSLTTGSGLAEALMAAKQRGVDVKLIADKSTPCERESGIEPLARAGVPIWVDRSVRIAHAKAMVIDRKVVLTGSINWTASAARNSDDINLISSEAVAAAYTVHWQNRLVASVPFARREDWCRSHEMAGLKSESPPR